PNTTTFNSLSIPVCSGTTVFVRIFGYNMQNTGTTFNCRNFIISGTTTVALSAASSGSGVTSCFGGNNGSASVTASDGSCPYSYSWSNGATAASLSNLTGGAYVITVTDAMTCTASSSFTVTQPAPLVVSCSGTNV